MIRHRAQILLIQKEGIEFTLVLPENIRLSRLFVNANWAHIIDPRSYKASDFKGLLQVPTTQFKSFEEQNDAVNKIMDKILGSLEGFTRSDIAAIEWSLNEITDNVINHSGSEVGGLVQLSTFQRGNKRVEYIVCDAGIGIPKSLRQTMTSLTSDSDALYHAIQEGVTKNKETNQGNGLFGTFEISRVSEGYLHIHSGYASLSYDKIRGLRSKAETIPFNGTLVIGCIDYSNPGLLGKALKFGGKTHNPLDYIESKFEGDDLNLHFAMKTEAKSFGSRKAAEPINIKLKNLCKLSKNDKIIIDFKDVVVISSSFADEVFGKLFIEMGPITFMQKFEFINTASTVKSLIDRAITQRSQMK